jgi:thiol-disulfide isomerase/thioredoxin
MIQVTDEKSLLSLLQIAPVVAVYFYGVHCSACKVAVKVVERFGQETGITVIGIDAEAYPGMASRLAVGSLPTVIIYKDDQPWQSLTEITLAKLRKATR